MYILRPINITVKRTVHPCPFFPPLWLCKSKHSVRIVLIPVLTVNPAFSSAVSHGDKDVQVEAVVRLPEEEDEDEAEEAGAGETPVQPRQV